jgi:holin-like protein
MLPVLRALAVLTAFWALGEAGAARTAVPIPGSVIGMLALWLALTVRAIPVRWIEAGARPLLTALPLLFVPIGAGIVVARVPLQTWSLVLPTVVVLTLAAIALAPRSRP